MENTKSEKKIGKVMKEFKKGELKMGQSSKKVTNPKQAIDIALSQAGKTRKGMMKGGLANSTRSFTSTSKEKDVDFAKFTHKDGYLLGGVEIETTNPQDTQVEPVGGQKAMLPEKKRSAKWY